MLMFELDPSASMPLRAWMRGFIYAVKLPLIGGETLLIVHGSVDPQDNLIVVKKYRELFSSATYVVACHNALMPAWVQKKVPYQLWTDKELELNLITPTSITVRVVE